jgi:hypothetical protein
MMAALLLSMLLLSDGMIKNITPPHLHSEPEYVSVQHIKKIKQGGYKYEIK